MQDRLQSDKCARRLKALADPDRLKIIQCLRGGPKVVSELIELLDNVMGNVSHHLRVLHHAGVVQTEKRGRFVVYSLHPAIVWPKDPRQPVQVLDFGCCRLDLRPSVPPAPGRP
jgi:DNA-binding transcriptional ArsR family regulator